MFLQNNVLTKCFLAFIYFAFTFTHLLFTIYGNSKKFQLQRYFKTQFIAIYMSVLPTENVNARSHL